MSSNENTSSSRPDSSGAIESGARLAGRVALVTGAGRGIGRAIAKAYAAEGATVCCAARTLAEVEDIVGEIENAIPNARALARRVDVRESDSVDALFNEVATELGGLDVLVLNAGIDGGREAVEDSDSSLWREVIETNLIGAYLCARAAVPLLRARGGGKIITIGSGLGHRGVPKSSAYACSKAALWMLTRVLAQELASFGISVNELIPGPVDTSMAPSRTDGRPPFAGSEWVKQPEDVVPLAVFLATQPEIGPTAQSFSLMRRDG